MLAEDVQGKHQITRGKLNVLHFVIGYRSDRKHIILCQDDFAKIHGISPARIRRLPNSLVTVGKPPRDERGLHTNRPNKFCNQVIYLIMWAHYVFSAKNIILLYTEKL